MKTLYSLSPRVWHYTFFFILLLSGNAYATTHIVTFTCCQYTPSNFGASVGDTVVWQGDFAAHPLQSTTIPSGADPFSHSTGTSFSYVLQVQGTYDYHCTIHQPSMAGSFNAALVGVDDKATLKPEAFRLHQNYPNPFNPSTMIQFSLPRSEFVMLRVLDILGEQITTLVSENLSAGTHHVEWNAHSMPSGVYFYRLQAGAISQTKKLVLLR